MGRAEAATNQPYQLYPGPRIADFNGDQQAAFQGARDLSGTYQPAQQAATGLAALAGAGSPSQYQAGSFSPDQVSAPNFDAAAAQQYMNPYISQVLDAQQARAQDLFGQQQLQRNGQAAMSGNFGGYRQGIQDAVAQRDFARQVSDNNATGLYQAFQNAQGQFNADRAAQTGVGEFNAQMGLSGFNANQGAQQQQEQLRQGGLGQLLNSASTLSNIGAQSEDSALKGIGALHDAGLQQQQQQQASLDLASQDFANQNNYDMNNLNFLSAILHGVPVTSNNTVSTYSASNPYSQVLGLGINGLALSNALGGKVG